MKVWLLLGFGVMIPTCLWGLGDTFECFVGACSVMIAFVVVWLCEGLGTFGVRDYDFG